MFHVESLVVISSVKTRQKSNLSKSNLDRFRKTEVMAYAVNPDVNFDLLKIVVCNSLTQPWCLTFFAPLCRRNNITLSHLLKPFDSKWTSSQCRYVTLFCVFCLPHRATQLKNARDPVKFLPGGNNTKYKEPLPVWFLIHFLKYPVCEHQSPL